MENENLKKLAQNTNDIIRAYRDKDETMRKILKVCLKHLKARAVDPIDLNERRLLIATLEKLIDAG